jgi:broad specificity phosphatase PhoE/predicted kinase
MMDTPDTDVMVHRRVQKKTLCNACSEHDRESHTQRVMPTGAADRKQSSVSGSPSPDAATRLIRQLQDLDSRIAEIERELEDDPPCTECEARHDDAPTLPEVTIETVLSQDEYSAHRRMESNDVTFSAMSTVSSAVKLQTHLHTVPSTAQLQPPMSEDLCTVEMCHYAAAGDLAPLEALLRAGYSPNRKDYDENTPLHVAAAHGQPEAAALLLQFNADLALTDQRGKTAIDVAVDTGHASIADLLKEHRAHVALNRDSDGDVPDSYGPDADGPGATSLGGHSLSNTQSGLGISWPMCSVTGAGDGHIFVMVGLPARGKSYVAKRIVRYWRWRGVPCKTFHFGKYRREMFGSFDRTKAPDQATGTEIEKTAKTVATDAAEYAVQTGGIAVIDGTNTVASRRNHLRNGLLAKGIAPNRIIFIEIVRDNPKVVHANIMRSYEAEVAAGKEEGTSVAKRRFVENYYEVVKNHERVARTLSTQHDNEYSFVRIANHNHVTLNRIEGVLATRLVYLLHNLWYEPYQLYFTVCGEWEDLVLGKLGGNSKLTEHGEDYATALAKYLADDVNTHTHKPRTIPAQLASSAMSEEDEKLMPSASGEVDNSSFDLTYRPTIQGPPLVIMCSVQTRARQTCAPIKSTPGLEGCVFRYLPTLNDLSYGDCEEQTPEDIKATLPNTLRGIQADPYNNAWPNGESVKSLFESRLEQHIHEIHSTDRPVLIVAHKPVIQGLLYFFNEQHDVTDPARALDFDVPLHHVLKLSPQGSSRVLEVVDLGVPLTNVTPRSSSGDAPPVQSRSVASPAEVASPVVPKVM